MADIFTGGPLNRGTKFLEDVPASLGAVAGAAYDRAFETNPTVMGIESYRRSSDTGEMLDFATVEKMQRENGVTFKIPKNGMPAGAAQMAIDAKYREKLQESVLARSQGGFLNKSAEFGSGLFASIFDPANLAVSVIPFAAGTKWSATLAMEGTTIAQRAAARAGIGATEGALGSLAVEPFNYAFARDIQKDYTMMDSLMNVTFGTIIGGGLHVGGGMLSDAFARTGSTSTVPPQSGTIGARVAGMPPEQVHETVALAVAQALNGRKIDVESVMPDVWRSNRSPDLAQALVIARESNTFFGQASGAGRHVGMTQPPDTPIEKLFSNFAYDIKTAEGAVQFREKMFDRANAEPQKFTNDTVFTFISDAENGLVFKVDAAKSGNTRVQVLDGENVVAAANIRNGMLDSIATKQEAKGRGVGESLLRYLDDQGIANIREVPDRSPGFVKIQKSVLSNPTIAEKTAEPNPTAPNERALTEAESSARPEMQRMYDAEAVKETNDILAAATETDNALRQEMQEAITKLKASGVDVEKMLAAEDEQIKSVRAEGKALDVMLSCQLRKG